MNLIKKLFVGVFFISGFSACTTMNSVPLSNYTVFTEDLRRDLEAAKEATGRGYRNTIIGVTAHALAGDRERCLQAGMDEYISKPVLPDILALKLGQLR